MAEGIRSHAVQVVDGGQGRLSDSPVDVTDVTMDGAEP